MPVCGLDFGTSNSALGVASAQGPRLVLIENHSELIATAVFFALDRWKDPRFDQKLWMPRLIAREPGRFPRGFQSVLEAVVRRSGFPHVEFVYEHIAAP